ncbi:methionine biosynthesis PLP-dependent protein [Heyndrickxia oleronia]|uniref:methionine biosynthesis PLP-dependent protein n=1 Tax=Heyndrickxia oleronia TaxID=38875 RepID=UPI00203F6DE1|nr:methionine biosynthesis PLP-dependent protein [Heyndrickxia oleronia]MCM3454702.1 methionine biosynthesis PLP-dependent protein [Heyndrickxia oleronia]
MSNHHIETNLVQIGNRSESETGAVNPPIFLSTAYRHEGIGLSTGFDYSRTKNPTRALLEDSFAKLEEGDQGFACSSGMAAIQLVLSLFESGDELIASDDLYGGTYRLFEHYAKAYGIVTKYINVNDIELVNESITEKTKAIFIETPTNPLMVETDITKVATFTKDHQLLLIVDNTFLTPYLQKPILSGADIVVHSATKYIGGHNDVLAGLVVAKGKEICEKLSAFHNGAGAVLSPFDSWLLIRGLKTLALRMEKHVDNAKHLVEFLNECQEVTDVLYPGRGGMVSFRLEKEEWISPFLRNLKLITFAESLGGVESFITYPATQTHGDIPEEIRIKNGVCNRLLRFSVGIEYVEDIKNDLEQAFQLLQKEEQFL